MESSGAPPGSSSGTYSETPALGRGFVVPGVSPWRVAERRPDHRQALIKKSPAFERARGFFMAASSGPCTDLHRNAPRSKERGAFRVWQGGGWLSAADRLHGLHQAVHLVIGADGDAQVVAQGLGVEVAYQDAALAQAGKQLGGILLGVADQHEVGL